MSRKNIPHSHDLEIVFKLTGQEQENKKQLKVFRDSAQLTGPWIIILSIVESSVVEN